MNSYNVKDIVLLYQKNETNEELKELSSQIDILYSKYRELTYKQTYNIEFTKQNGKKGVLFITPNSVLAKIYTDTGEISDQYVNLDKLKIVSYKQINKNK